LLHIAEAKQLEAEGFRDGAARVLAGWLNHRSWVLVQTAGLSEREYTRALRRTEAVCRLRPDCATDVNLNVTLGVAQYRAGKFKEALATLVRAGKVDRSAKTGYPRATILLFTALCHERLGDRERARAVLAEARSEIQAPMTGEISLFLDEAEREIGAPEAPPASPAQKEPQKEPETPPEVPPETAPKKTSE
jgi:uncharacterized protein HemY